MIGIQALLCMALVLPAMTQETDVSMTSSRRVPIPLEISGFVSKPVALGVGLVHGVSVSARMPLRWGFSVVLGRADWGWVSEANQVWQFQQHELRLCGGMQWQYDVGRGRVWSRAVLGGMLIYEKRKRQQAERLEGVAGVDTHGHGVSVGPYGQWELGIGVHAWPGWLIGLHAGPAGSVQTINHSVRLSWGWLGGIGVEHAF